MKITFIFSCSRMFRHVPACSGMFQNIPCSGFYRRPTLRVAGHAMRCRPKTKEVIHNCQVLFQIFSPVAQYLCKPRCTIGQKSTVVSNSRSFFRKRPILKLEIICRFVLLFFIPYLQEILPFKKKTNERKPLENVLKP